MNAEELIEERRIVAEEYVKRGYVERMIERNAFLQILTAPPLVEQDVINAPDQANTAPIG